MNADLKEHVREEIKKGLDMLNEKQSLVFRKMYSHKDIKKPIDEIVDAIPEDKLDHVLFQIQNTLDRN